MENREAIEILQRNIPGCDYDLSEAVELAIAALEKQIPKRKLEKDQYNENLFTLRCPTCGERVGNYNGRLNTFSHMALINYCPKCGQAIDFSKPQEEQDG
jgi:rRNA maturation protein Nop10